MIEAVRASVGAEVIWGREGGHLRMKPGAPLALGGPVGELSPCTGDCEEACRAVEATRSHEANPRWVSPPSGPSRYIAVFDSHWGTSHHKTILLFLDSFVCFLSLFPTSPPRSRTSATNSLLCPQPLLGPPYILVE